MIPGRWRMVKSNGSADQSFSKDLRPAASAYLLQDVEDGPQPVENVEVE